MLDIPWYKTVLLGDQPSHSPVVINVANDIKTANVKCLSLNASSIIVCVNVYINHNIAQYIVNLDQDATTGSSNIYAAIEANVF